MESTRASVEVVGFARFWRFGGGGETGDKAIDHPLPSPAASTPPELPAKQLLPAAQVLRTEDRTPQDKARSSVEVVGIARFWRSSVSLNQAALVVEHPSPHNPTAPHNPSHHVHAVTPLSPSPAPVTVGHSARVLYALITGKTPPVASRAPRWGSKKHSPSTPSATTPLPLLHPGLADPKLNLATSHAAAPHRHVEARPVPFVSPKALKKLKSQLIKPVCLMILLVDRADAERRTKRVKSSKTLSGWRSPSTTPRFLPPVWK
mgnify:CR=1 FL=1